MNPRDLLYVLSMHDPDCCQKAPLIQMWRELNQRCCDSTRIGNICNFVKCVTEAYDAGQRVAVEDKWLALQCCLAVLAERDMHKH